MSRKSTEDFFQEQGPHSRIKSEIVHKYFFPWARICAKREGRVMYMDLYAGPGKYEDGTPSTPLLVLKEIIDNPELHNKVVTFFGDRLKTTVAKLDAAIKELPDVGKLRFPPIARAGQVTGSLAADLAKLHLIPTFMFLDPFGYKGVSADLIAALLRHPGSECVFFFNYRRVPWFLENRNARHLMEAIFGADRVRLLRETLPQLPPPESERAIIDALRSAMKDSGAEYVRPFRFRKDGRTTHFLIFVSRNALGYKIMKEVMAKESNRFYQGSGAYPGVSGFEYVQGGNVELFEPTPLDDLKEDLLRKFAGDSVTVAQAFDRHNVDTDYVVRDYKEAIKQLMREKRVPEGVRTEEHKPPLKPPYKTMPEDVLIEFPKI